MLKPGDTAPPFDLPAAAGDRAGRLRLSQVDSEMVVLFFMMRGGMMHRHPPRDAVDVLKERYARGEINEAEYRERRRLLEA